MILIKNIYYMLSYAYKALNQDVYKSVATESFDNVADLCAAILEKGITSQLKQGLAHDYVPCDEVLAGVRGKIEINESLKCGSLRKRQLVCTYEDFTVDIYMNQIIKATVSLLLRSDIKKIHKKNLKRLMMFFSDVSDIDVHEIKWNLRFTKGNQSYRLLMGVCYLVIKGLLQSQSDGSIKLMNFVDDQRMYHLYERFVLEYYRKEFPQIKVSSSQIPWQLDEGDSAFLPIMQSDVMLTYGDRTLIIDTKYYEQTVQQRYGGSTFISSNLYQIYTYVKNKQILEGDEHVVSGMLLYAQTDGVTVPPKDYSVSGNTLSVRFLDLNQDFCEIKKQLNMIVERAFDVVTP